MMPEPAVDDRVRRWLAALDERHLADLTPSEVARALRALSSCYVERRARLGEGGALDGAGKRAAFALFYAPLHFLVVRHIATHLPAARDVVRIQDVGCGSGAAGAAWALQCQSTVRVSGFDRHGWAVDEANWTYRQLGVTGRAARADLARARIEGRRGTGVLAAYVLNELDDAGRERTLGKVRDAHAAGSRLLIVEPIAKRLAPWWPEWEDAIVRAGVVRESQEC